jgi:hypothetical protein
VNLRVRFDIDADVEYRLAARWYEARREHLGIEFLDAVDATIDQIVALPQPLRWSGGCRTTYRSDAGPSRAFLTTSSTWR